MRSIWVLIVNHKHGRNVSTHATEELAHRELFAYVTEWWDAEMAETAKQLGKLNAAEAIAAYFARVEAIQFTIAHDDGQSLDSIDEAEVILTGASRTSKTPTCVYLAIRPSTLPCCW